MKGIKHDTGKLRWYLLPLEPLRDVVKVLMMGAVKYAPNNWKNVRPKSRYHDALIRHLDAWQAGEKNDPESGLPHLAHLICNALFLSWHDEHPQRKIYIAGPMTGYENYNFQAFFDAETRLIEDGYAVVNPARLSKVVWEAIGEENAKREDYYRIDFRELTKCDEAYFLTGWEYSEGARLEHDLCGHMGIRIRYENNPKN